MAIYYRGAVVQTTAPEGTVTANAGGLTLSVGIPETVLSANVYANYVTNLVTVLSNVNNPGGNPFDVQYKTPENTFGGDSDFTYDPNTNKLSVAGSVSAGAIRADAILFGNGAPMPVGYSTSNLIVDLPNVLPLYTGNLGFSNAITLGNSNVVINGGNGALKLGGGNLGETLITDGAASLSWGYAHRLANGTSNVIVYANGNVATSVGGVANVVVVTPTGANITGTSNVTGNSNVGNNLNVAANAVIGGNATVGAELVVVGNANVVANINGNSNLNITQNAVIGGNANVGANLHVLGNSILGSNANVFITGGSNGQTLVTNGAGNLSWGYTSTLANGNSNVVVYANGNVATSVSGIANVLVVTVAGANLAGNIDTTMDANIGGTLRVTANANITGNLYAMGNSILGSNANVKISGGTPGLTLVPNISGGGNLDWGYTSGIANGNSSVTIPAANGNVVINAAGGTDEIVVSAGAVGVTGNLSVTGVSNLGPNGNVKITGGTANQVLTTDGTGNLSWANVQATELANALRFSNTGTGNTANIDFNGNTANLVVSWNTVGAASGNVSGWANVGLGPVPNSNVKITGGNANQVLTAYGNGDVFWSTPLTLPLANGTSNIDIPVAGGNVNTSVGGVANVFTVTTTGTVTTGTSNTTGNVNVLGTVNGVDAIFSGNLSVNGTTTYINVDTLSIEDPIIELGTGPNGTPLTTNDGKDRGQLYHTYGNGTADSLRFMGWKNAGGTNEFVFGSNVTDANGVITVNTYGNVRAGNYFGNGQLTNLNVSGTSNLGPVGNVTITGGSNGQVLTTNGSGVLTWSNVVVGNAIRFANTGAGNAANVDFNGNTANLVVSWNTLGAASGNAGGWANVGLGPVSNANVIVTGGTSGQTLITNGTGALSWNYIDRIANGTSSVTIPAANGSVRITAAGGTTEMVVSNGIVDISGNTYILGSLEVAGVSNLGPVGNVIITGGSNGQILTTNGSGVLSWTSPTVSNAIRFTNDGTGTPANIDYNGNTAGYVVSWNTVGAARGNAGGWANVGVGPIPNSNVQITGGTSGQMLTTYGNGNLYWSQVSSIANTTSNVAIPTAAGNVVTSVGGTANVVTTHSGGMVIAGAIGTTSTASFTGEIYGSKFNGSITGTILTVTSMIAGTIISGPINSVGLFAGTAITGQLSGTPGGVGTYSLNQNNGWAGIGYGVGNTMYVSTISSGMLTVGSVIDTAPLTFVGLPAGTYITAQISGKTGANGVYTLSGSGTTFSVINMNQYPYGTPSTSSTTGALVVYGGAGIGGTLNVGTAVISPLVRTTPMTVAQLPSPTIGAGCRAYVTDSLVVTFMSPVASGGANGVPVVSTGTSWVVG